MLKLFDIASARDVGKIRKGSSNQDSIKIIDRGLFQRKAPFLILADGMGGHAGGALAGEIVVETFRRAYLKSKKNISPREFLEDAVLHAHHAVRDASQKSPELNAMGSTVVAAILENDHLHCINVGDSRLYVFKEKQICQVSFDQSVVADKVRCNEITIEEAFTHPERNKLTMSIIARREVVVPCYAEQALEFNDVILLCSDGLWGVVPEKLIRAAACQLKPADAVKKLINLANGFGGPDNISLIIARRVGSVLETNDESDEFG